VALHVIVRTPRGLDVFKGAMESGYIKAIAINPIYVIQPATIFKLTKRVLLRSNQNYLLPPSISSIMHELVYHLGSFLASREKLWGLLKLFHGAPKNILMFVASILDFKLGTEWSHIVKSIWLLQRASSENVSTPLKNFSIKGNNGTICTDIPGNKTIKPISMQMRLLTVARNMSNT